MRVLLVIVGAIIIYLGGVSMGERWASTKYFQKGVSVNESLNQKEGELWIQKEMIKQSRISPAILPGKEAIKQ